MFIFTWFLIPETKGLSLEKMDALFGFEHPSKAVDEEAWPHTPHVQEKGAQATSVEHRA